MNIVDFLFPVKLGYSSIYNLVELNKSRIFPFFIVFDSKDLLKDYNLRNLSKFYAPNLNLILDLNSKTANNNFSIFMRNLNKSCGYLEIVEISHIIKTRVPKSLLFVNVKKCEIMLENVKTSSLKLLSNSRISFLTFNADGITGKVLDGFCNLNLNPETKIYFTQFEFMNKNIFQRSFGFSFTMTTYSEFFFNFSPKNKRVFSEIIRNSSLFFSLFKYRPRNKFHSDPNPKKYTEERVFELLDIKIRKNKFLKFLKSLES